MSAGRPHARRPVFGVPTCVRINHQIASWSIQDPPSEWAQTRARWVRFHIIRELFSVPAFAVYLLAAAVIGLGTGPTLVALSNGTVLASWEDHGGIAVERIP